MNNITLFAKTNFRGKEQVFGIKDDDRRRHMYVIGKTGMGKTNLLQTMIVQDIYAGKGLAFVDPHGDTAETLLNFLPKSRINDIVYFNPADMSYPVAFNVLETVDEEHKHLVASGMMGVFKKIWPDVWSPRMEHILNHTILALLDYPGSTMLGINRMLSDKQFRNKVLNRLKDPIVKSFWVNEFAKWNERYMGEAIAPIQNKVGQFLATPIIRNIVSQTKSTINMREIMDQGKILIVNLSKGRIGEEAMQLLGGMVVTKLQLAAMERVDTPEDQRRDFYLYVDEFQNFATESFANILSEARKYRLNLIMSHQYISQLINDGNTYVKDAVFGNVGTLICFRIGAEDAELIEKEFEPVISAYDLVNLPKYQVYLKLMIDGIAGDVFSATSLPPLSIPPEESAQKAIKVSRERYGRDRKIIEEKIARWSQSLPGQDRVITHPRKQIRNITDQNKVRSANANSSVNTGNISSISVNSNNLSNQPKDRNKTEKNNFGNDRPGWFPAVCDECGKRTKIPFQPDGKRGVYCKECLGEIKSQRAKLLKLEGNIKDKMGRFDKSLLQNNKPDWPTPISLKEAVKIDNGKDGRKSIDLEGVKKLIEKAREPEDKKEE